MLTPCETQMARRKLRTKEALTLFLLRSRLRVSTDTFIIRPFFSLIFGTTHFYILRAGRLGRTVRVFTCQRMPIGRFAKLARRRERRRRKRSLAREASETVTCGRLGRGIFSAWVFVGGRRLRIAEEIAVRSRRRGCRLFARTCRRGFRHGKCGVDGLKSRHFVQTRSVRGRC